MNNSKLLTIAMTTAMCFLVLTGCKASPEPKSTRLMEQSETTPSNDTQEQLEETDITPDSESPNTDAGIVYEYDDQGNIIGEVDPETAPVGYDNKIKEIHLEE